MRSIKQRNATAVEKDTPLNNSQIGPVSRKTDLTIEELALETVVYDHKRNRMHCLNPSTSFIWRRCDGQTKLEEIAARLPEVDLPADLDVVRGALKALDRAHLLEGEPSFAISELPSRRKLGQRLGLAAASVLPVITSAVAPTPAMAKSGDKHDNDKKPKKEKNNLSFD